MNVEEGRFPANSNTTSADTEAELRAYFLRKRSISIGASLFLVLVSALVAVWSPYLGLVLAIGGVCGVANILLVMRNNERLLDGNRSRMLFATSNMVRIIVAGAIPVIVSVHGPWWAMGIYFAGFFTPLAWYAVALQRSFQRGT
jgi:hypothetical protein